MIGSFDGGAFISYAVRHKVSLSYEEKENVFYTIIRTRNVFLPEYIEGKISMISRYY